MLSASLALAGVAFTVASWIGYMAAIARERVPPRPRGHLVLQLAAIASSLSAIALAGDAWRLPVGTAVLTLPLAALFLFLLSEAPVPDAAITVHVGGPLRPFRAVTSTGAPWSTDAVRGQRLLLKFFRGSW